MNKLGKSKITAIFPKLIFFHRNNINGFPNSHNYDIKKLAIKCSMENQYPDWLDCDHGYVGEIYNRTGKPLMLMGCRAHLSPWFNKDGVETYTGRFNVGAVTWNCVKTAIESNGDEEKFIKLMEEYFKIMLEFLLYRYEKLSKIKAKTNPLMFTEGGCCIQLKPEETLEKVLVCATASFGFIGLAEATLLMTGKSMSEDNSFAIRILSRYKELINKACEDHNRLFALYATPSEGLCMKALELDKQTYGIIKGVTDKAWYTNSFHINVCDEVTAIRKIELEKPMFEICTGGRIFYSEWPHMDNEEAVEQYINICMKNGLYMGINFENCTCMDCGHNKFDAKICPKCGSENLTIIDRVCGYLGIRKSNGETRYNNGKKEEVDNRVKHFNIIKGK